MFVPVIAVSAALLGYWLSRTAVLLYGSLESIARMLEDDYRRGLRLWSSFR
jgi:hypothetical protein